jgi:hypothetical protein
MRASRRMQPDTGEVATLGRALECKMLNQAAMPFALLPLLAAPPAPYDERADARAELARMRQCARAEQKPLLVMFGEP